MWEFLGNIAGNLIGGGLSALGASNQNAANQAIAREQMEFSRQQAELNRQWQERMSNTAYQRAMADMRVAGLNPILAYQQGGAGTPSGAQGYSAGAHMENALEGLGRGVASAGSAARFQADLDNTRAQTANTTAQEAVNKTTALKNVQDTATSAAQEQKAKAEAALTAEQIESPAAQRALYGAQAHSAYQAGEVSRRQAADADKYGDSPLGRLGASAERVGRRLYDAMTGPGETRPAPVYPNALPAYPTAPPSEYQTRRQTDFGGAFSETWRRLTNRR